MEETDSGHSSSTNSTPKQLPLAAVVTTLPLQESTDSNTGEKNGINEKQEAASNIIQPKAVKIQVVGENMQIY